MVETSVQTFHLNGNLTLLENDVHKKTGRYKPWLHSTFYFPTSCWSTLLSLCLGDGCLLNIKISGSLYQIVLIVVQLLKKTGLMISEPKHVCYISWVPHTGLFSPRIIFALFSLANSVASS